MQDNYFYSFKYFSPKLGVLPDPYAVMFVEQIHRARKILVSFSDEAIKAATIAINKVVRDESFVNHRWEDLKNEPIPTLINGEIMDIVPSTNDIETIYKNIGNVRITDHIQLPGFSWPQVFAAITLYYPELIMELLETQANWKSEHIKRQISDEQIISFANEFIQDAKQAITIAELLLNQDSMQKQFQSQQTRLAAKIKHEKTSIPLKNLVIAEYVENYQNRSNRDAASKVLKSLIDKNLIQNYEKKNQIIFNGVIALQTDDPEKRFEIWIGQYKQGKQN